MKRLCLMICVFGLIFMLATGLQASLSDGLVAYYPFNGNANDESGNGNHGTENGGPSYVSGVSGEAISLDGMDDYVIVEENKAPPMRPAGTISGWLKIPSTFPFPRWGAGFVNKMLHSSGLYLYDFGIGHDGPCFAGIGDGSGAPGEETTGKYVYWSESIEERRAVQDYLFDDTWHYLAYTWDSDELILYIDGAFQNSTTHSVNVYANDPMQWDLNIGRRAYASATNWKYLQASIDEVRIYDRALSQAEVMELAGSPEPRMIDRLTDDIREEHCPVWSPDGTKIAYVSRPEGGSIGELHVIDLTTGSVNIIYDYVLGRCLHWVGDYIAFLKCDEPSTPGNNEVWKIKEDGTDLQQITFTYTNGIDQHIWGHDGVGTARIFALSPDGSKLAFVANHGNGWFDPYVCNADGSDGYVLLQNLSHCFYIKWNADGSKVYYAAGSDYYPPQTMYRSNPDGSGDETITGNLPQNNDFVFSPDGSTVAMITGIFHRPCKGCTVDQIDRNLTIMNPDGTGRTNLLKDSFDEAFGRVCTLTKYDPGYAHHPSFHVWAPDNDTIVFTSNRSGNFDIWTIKKDGTGLTQITTDSAHDYDAGFSPDGSKILFISERDGQRDLYLMVPEPAVTEVGVDIDPDVLNLKSRGRWITCYIWLPEEYDVADVNPDSLKLDGVIDATWSWIEDEEQILMAKFPRSAAQEILEPGEVELTVNGELIDGTKFEGSDTIKVIDKGGKK